MGTYMKTGDQGFTIESHNGVYTAVIGAVSKVFENLFDAIEWVEAMRTEGSCPDE